MINPALEYVSRHPDILSLDLPCSFMAKGVDGEPKVVAVHSLGHDEAFVHVKTWHLNKTVPTDIFPPSSGDNYPREILEKPWMFFPKDVHPIGYNMDFPSVSNNRRDRPIPQVLYDAIGSGIYFSRSHHETRRDFLWRAFEQVFIPGTRAANYHTDEYKMEALRRFEPRKYQYWGMWKIHMLDFSNKVAPELYYWATSVSSSSS